MPPKRKAPPSSSRGGRGNGGRGGRGPGNQGSKRAAGGRGGVQFDLGDEHIDEGSGSDNEEVREGARLKVGSADLDDDVQETAAEKRVRLAKQYLATMEAAIEAESSEEGSSDEEAGVGDSLGARLEKERLKAAGQLKRTLAAKLQYLQLQEEDIRILKGHKLSPTCVALTADERIAFSGGKDDAVIRFDVETGARTYLAPSWRPDAGHQAHEKEVLSLAVSSDSRYLVAGGRDNEIRVWDIRSNNLVKTFTGHRDAVSALAFRTDTHSLYSGSFDRCLKHWNLDSMAYVETQFGHQSEINAIDAWRKERPITCGRDRTVRIWKLIDESHMLLKAPQGGERGVLMGGSMDCLAMLSEEAYVTGGEDGVLAMWSINKKKPTVMTPSAHGEGNNHWISSVAAVKGSDLVASGSDDGFIRLWHANPTQPGHGSALTQIAALSVPGYVNGLQIGSSGSVLVAAVGKEHRLGRWAPQKGAKNGIYVIRLKGKEVDTDDKEEDDDGDEEDEEEDDEEEEKEEASSVIGEKVA